MEFHPGPSWCHPALTVREIRDGDGPVSRTVCAAAPIPAGALLCVMGGRVVGAAEFAALPDLARRQSIQVGEDGAGDGLYLISDHPAAITDHFDHACDPNAVLEGAAALRARRDIAAGEAVRYDYATSDGSPYDEFDCACGCEGCRGRVTGEDWRRPELQARYAGRFSPYLEARIRAIR